jgi:hyperosmotically inducible periplasmic protein
MEKNMNFYTNLTKGFLAAVMTISAASTFATSTNDGSTGPAATTTNATTTDAVAPHDSTTTTTTQTMTNDADSAKPIAPADDGVIVNTIKNLFMADPQLNTSNIEVSSVKGDVQLKGALDTDEQYEKAVMIAGSVDGVQNVNTDELTVKDSKQPLKDLYITAKIKGALIKNKLLDPKNIEFWSVHVETKDGIVYLTGTVDDQSQKDNMVKIIQSVQGVGAVNTDGLTVKQ